MSSARYDVALLPTAVLTQKAIATSRQLTDAFDSLFTLQTDTFVPHISLYMVLLQEHNLPRARELLAGITVNTPAIALNAERYGQADGYIDASYQRSDEIAQLQMAVVEAINPIRDGMRAKDEARMQGATGAVRESLGRYGYDSVGKAFRPHLTFTRFTNDRAIDVSTLPEPSEFSGQFIQLGLFELGAHGTCKRQLAVFDLKKGGTA